MRTKDKLDFEMIVCDFCKHTKLSIDEMIIFNNGKKDEEIFHDLCLRLSNYDHAIKDLRERVFDLEEILIKMHEKNKKDADGKP